MEDADTTYYTRATRLALFSRQLAAYTSEQIEWVWLLSRLCIIGVVALAVSTTAVDERSASPLLAAVGFVALYNVLLGALLRFRLVAVVFILGVFLDTVTILATWWVVARDYQGADLTTDLYLAMVPLLTVNAVRFRFPMTVAYLALFMAWMAWTITEYYDPTGYDAVQLPVRMALISLTILLIAYLVHVRRREARVWRTQEKEVEAAIADLEAVRRQAVNANRTLRQRNSDLAFELQHEVRSARLALTTTPPEADTRLEYIRFLETVEDVICRKR